MKSRCIILGAGGHARALIEMLSGLQIEAVLLDADSKKWGQEIDGCRVLGDDALLAQASKDSQFFLLGIGSVGKSTTREKLYFMVMSETGLKPLTVIHPSAIISPNSEIHSGCQIFPGAVVNRGAVLSENVLINSRALVEHDCEIGAHSHIASGAVLCGGVNIGRSCLVGAGAVVRQGIKIGTGSVIGAGAVVVEDVPDNVTVLGVPAKIRKM